MNKYKITIKGNNDFSLTHIYEATKIETAILNAITVCFPLTDEKLVQVIAVEQAK